MYDCYSSGYYQFCSSPDLKEFTFVKNTATSGAFTPRHGTVIPLTAERRRLARSLPHERVAYGTVQGHPAILPVKQAS